MKRSVTTVWVRFGKSQEYCAGRIPGKVFVEDPLEAFYAKRNDGL